MFSIRGSCGFLLMFQCRFASATYVSLCKSNWHKLGNMEVKIWKHPHTYLEGERPQVLWVLPTPWTILFLGLDRKLYHPVSKWESHKLSFQLLERSWDTSYWRRGQSGDCFFFSFMWSHRPSQLCELLNMEGCLYYKHIVQFHCDTCLLLFYVRP